MHGLLAHLRPLLRVSAASVLLAAAAASPAAAGPGYELDPVKPSITLAGQIPHGVAIDQASQALYVTELTTDFENFGHGQIEQFNSSGVPTASSPFVTGGTDFFTGVAVNPATHGIYAYQAQLSTPVGLKGISQMNAFSSAGVLGPSFNPAKSTAPQLAADASGRIYFPNDAAGTVQILSSSGVPESSISCTGCPGGAFSKPSGVALDGSGKLYVVDLDGGGRVIKFTSSGASYTYDSVLQSGEGAAAVGVDPASGDVFVGDFADGVYRIAAYDSSGAQFDDFGGGTVSSPPFEIETAGQIAASATTHKVYVSDPVTNVLWVFDRLASIPAPTAVTSSASSLGQVEATLSASVDPKDHGLSDCHFEYTDHADFLAHGFSGATSVPCSSRPAGPPVTASARVTGLAPATDYDYRISVTSYGGSVEGAGQAFKTLPALAPSASAGSAFALTQTTATITGSVNPHGGPVSNCHFEYTGDADFQKNAFAGAVSASCVPLPQGTSNVAVSAKVKNLAAGTGYRFRIVATNNSGTTEGLPQAFSTLADTCATKLALCPLPEERHEQVIVQPLPTAPTVKPLKCRKGYKKKTVRGKRKCVKVKRHRRRRG